MGLDIYVLRNPTFVKSRDEATDEDYDTLTLIYNDEAFFGHADGLPQGLYRGELSKRHGGWSYSGYGHLRDILCRAAFGVGSQIVWSDPERFASHRLSGLVPLIGFSDCEGAIGPATCERIINALYAVPLDDLTDAEREYAEHGRDQLLACLRDARDHRGFAVWR
jgi:hypothetical protein